MFDESSRYAIMMVYVESFIVLSFVSLEGIQNYL